MPSTTSTHSSPVVLPDFKVKDGWILSCDAYSAVVDAEMALRVLADYVDTGNSTPDEPMSEELRLGLGYLMRLISRDINGRVFEDARTLNNSTVQRLLDKEAQEVFHE